MRPTNRYKEEFSIKLTAALKERNWNQSDLAREVLRVTGRTIGRDAISTYVKARCFPTPLSLAQICKALSMSAEELLPDTSKVPNPDEQPMFEFRAIASQPGMAWLHVNRTMSFDTATEIARLINLEDKSNQPN